jgi:hypothetical protein
MMTVDPRRRTGSFSSNNTPSSRKSTVCSLRTCRMIPHFRCLRQIFELIQLQIRHYRHLSQETGMDDYAHKAAMTGSIYLNGIWEYNLYCHYVAGLFSEGLSRLFSASGKEADWVASQLDISNSCSKRPPSFATSAKTSTSADFSGHARYGVARSTDAGDV